MDSELRKALADCLSDMERGAGVEDCLKRNPGLAAELRPHLETWRTISGASLAQPSTAAFNSGRQVMLAAVGANLGGAHWKPALGPVAAALTGALLLFGGAGASAALGGPDVAEDAVGGVVGVFNNEDDGGVNDADDGDVANLNEDCVAEASPTPEASPDASPTPEASPVADDEDDDRGHGNDADHDDDDNPGQGQGNHGTDTGNGDNSAQSGGNANKPDKVD